jgi:hypothetical protein
MTKLAKLMADKGLNDSTLAELARAPEQEIWRLRKGPHNRGQKMTLAWAQRLAAALNVDLGDLLDDDPAALLEEARAEPIRPTPKPRAAASARQAAKGGAMRSGGHDALNRDDLRVIHGLISACALSRAPNVQISADAFHNLIERAIENAAYDYSELSALADKVATLLASGEF